MTKLLTFLACLLFGHQADKDNLDHYIGDCARCKNDVRSSWMVELEQVDRLEALAIKYLEQTRRGRA